MERESFEDPEIAALMNERFVCVKVDREERPDVDAICMEACQAMTGHGGWPLNAFLTPEQVPFYAGTYFPPEPRHGHAELARWCCSAVADAWRRAPRGDPRAGRRSSSQSLGATRAARAVGRADRAELADRGASPALRGRYDRAQRRLRAARRSSRRPR